MEKIINYIDVFEEKYKKFVKYKYFDTPDGQDVCKKMYYTSATTTQAGILFSCYQVLLKELTPTWQHGVVRAASLTWPFTVAGLLYSGTTFMSCRLRNKDDELNHFFGGLSVGLAIYYRYKRPSYAWGYGLFLGVVGLVFKSLKKTDMGNSSWSQALISSCESRCITYDDKIVDWRLAYKPTKTATMFSGPGQRPTPPLLYSETPKLK
ncbi:unnamed protein product [Gordionus sp. m RMFG-2023]|uniref:uncharacterized protein LOC135928388 n=1 Tax=Gordionus sp. m RMFG-2023 TaxID=3053472 RepID=UPI0030E440E8